MNARIYYGDGTVFDGRPEDAPTENVQVIAWDDPTRGLHDVGRVLLSEWDFYIYSDHVGSWHGTSKYHDLIQHLRQGCGPGGVRAVLTGRWISREAFFDIRERALHDELFRPKSAVIPNFEDGRE